MKGVYALAVEVKGELVFLSDIKVDVDPIKISFSNDERDIRFMSLKDAEWLQDVLHSGRGLKTEIVSIQFED